MIILFHCLSILIFQLLRNRKRIKLLEIESKKLSIESNLPINVDLEFNLKFDPPVYRQRYARVYETLIDERWRANITSLVDFGCSEFGLFVFIKRLNYLKSIFFVDIDEDLLKHYVGKLNPLIIDHLKRRSIPLEISVFAGSVSDPDDRLLNTDVVTAVELIEHLYPDVLDAFPYNVFHHIKPKVVIVTTPNSDFNVLFCDDLQRFRHYDHKFEWRREQFEEWANNITVRFPNYTVSFSGIGEGPEGTSHLGYCSQMAVFIRNDLLTDNCISKNDNLLCLCDNSSPCRGSSLISKLLCNCICSSCVPSASFGICTYNSCSKQNVCEDEDPSHNLYYKLLDKIEYPFEHDSRTEEEKMCDELKYRIHNMGYAWGRFFVEEKSRSEIPLQDLLYGCQGFSINEGEVSKLLTGLNFKVEECRVQETGLIQTCVIYEPVMEEISSTSEASGYDSDITKYQLNEESLSDWDDPCVKKENENLCDECKGFLEEQNSFPHWLLQILGSHVIVDGEAAAATQEEPHFYCQGDGLGVHPSVIAVEIDEEEDDTTESSNNTADFADLDQGPSTQDMSSLPEDSQTNPLDNTETEEAPATSAATQQNERVESNSNTDVGPSGSS